MIKPNGEMIMKITLTKEEKFHAKELAYKIQADLVNWDQATTLSTRRLCDDVTCHAWNLTNEHTKRKQYNELKYLHTIINFKKVD